MVRSCFDACVTCVHRSTQNLEQNQSCESVGYLPSRYKTVLRTSCAHSPSTGLWADNHQVVVLVGALAARLRHVGRDVGGLGVRRLCRHFLHGPASYLHPRSTFAKDPRGLGCRGGHQEKAQSHEEVAWNRTQMGTCTFLATCYRKSRCMRRDRCLPAMSKPAS